MSRKKVTNPGLFVIGEQKAEGLPNVSSRTLITEENVPESGIYRVLHEAHRLPHEVTLIGGERFPRCGGCGEAVEFELLQAAPYIGHLTNTVRLYELPVLKDTEAQQDQGTIAS